MNTQFNIQTVSKFKNNTLVLRISNKERKLYVYIVKSWTDCFKWFSEKETNILLHPRILPQEEIPTFVEALPIEKLCDNSLDKIGSLLKCIELLVPKTTRKLTSAFPLENVEIFKVFLVAMFLNVHLNFLGNTFSTVKLPLSMDFVARCFSCRKTITQKRFDEYKLVFKTQEGVLEVDYHSLVSLGIFALPNLHPILTSLPLKNKKKLETGFFSLNEVSSLNAVLKAMHSAFPTTQQRLKELLVRPFCEYDQILAVQSKVASLVAVPEIVVKINEHLKTAKYFDKQKTTEYTTHTSPTQFLEESFTSGKEWTELMCTVSCIIKTIGVCRVSESLFKMFSFQEIENLVKLHKFLNTHLSASQKKGFVVARTKSAEYVVVDSSVWTRFQESFEKVEKLEGLLNRFGELEKDQISKKVHTLSQQEGNKSSFFDKFRFKNRFFWVSVVSFSFCFVPVLGFFLCFKTDKEIPYTEKTENLSFFFSDSNKHFFKTKSCRELDTELGDVFFDAIFAQNKVLNALKVYLQSTFLSSFLKTFDKIVELDKLIVLAKLALSSNLKRPKLTKRSAYRFENSKHLLLSFFEDESGVAVIENNLCFSVGDIVLLVGPNGSGKSLLGKQFLLNILLTHIGSFIPTNYSEVALTSSLFVLGDYKDKEKEGLSSFQSDLKRVAKLVRKVEASNNEKLNVILIDEFGKGTDPLDGACLLIALINWLDRKREEGKRMVAIFITNLMDILKIELLPKTVSTLMMDYEEVDEKLSFQYKLCPYNKESSKGILFAQQYFPAKVIQRAEVVKKKLLEI